MIGQHDPFTDPPRAAPRHAQSVPQPQYSEQRHAEPQRYAEPPHGEAPSLDWPEEPAPFRSRQAPPQPARNAPQAHTPQYFEQPKYAPAAPAQRAQSQYAPEDYQRREDAPPFGGGREEYDQQSYYRDPDAEELYEQAAPKRRGGMVTVLAVLALAVLGTAAAFGYRSIFGSSDNAPPPVVRADGAPNKVAAAGSGEQSKLIYDRVGDKSQTERIVVREEQPVDVKTQPRVIPTTQAAAANPVAQPPAPQMPASASALAPAQTGPISTEPKKVRTVTIRPDQPSLANSPAVRSAMPAAQPQSARAPAAQPGTQPATQPAAQVATIAPADSAPMQVSPPAAAPQPAPVRQSTPRVAPVRAQPQAEPVPSGNAPLSLSPPSAAPAPATARMRTASAPAMSASASADGGYTVQVSSQRSESEAQASFRSLQARFPNQLGDRQPIIRRADLGSRGIYYRAQVGPFASQDDAASFCSNLKSAGGQCVVQRN